MSKAILLGPYVGSFTHEILTFRPHIRYISHTLGGEADLFVSSHANRSFLYDWVSPDNFIPIYEHISRNEPSQVGFIYDDITKTEFNQITKKIKTEIPYDDVESHTLPYVKSTAGISYFQKLYSPFDIPDIDVGDVDVVVIMDKSDESSIIYELLSQVMNVTVIGDMNNGLEDENILMRHPVFHDNYLKMFNYIKKAKYVVTNCGEWALICNCQGYPVFYWGQESSLYKTSGVMNFGNNKCSSICSMEPKSIVNMIRYCYDKMYGD